MASFGCTPQKDEAYGIFGHSWNSTSMACVRLHLLGEHGLISIEDSWAERPKTESVRVNECLRTNFGILQDCQVSRILTSSGWHRRDPITLDLYLLRPQLQKRAVPCSLMVTETNMKFWVDDGVEIRARFRGSTCSV